MDAREVPFGVHIRNDAQPLMQLKAVCGLVRERGTKDVSLRTDGGRPAGRGQVPVGVCRTGGLSSLSAVKRFQRAFDASVDQTPLIPVPGNAISNEPGVPLSRWSWRKGPGSLQPEQKALRREYTSALRTSAGYVDRLAPSGRCGPKHFAERCSSPVGEVDGWRETLCRCYSECVKTTSERQHMSREGAESDVRLGTHSSREVGAGTPLPWNERALDGTARATRSVCGVAMPCGTVEDE